MLRNALIAIRDEGLDVPTAAALLKEALSRTGQYRVLAHYVKTALGGCVIDPEGLPASEDLL